MTAYLRVCEAYLPAASFQHLRQAELVSGELLGQHPVGLDAELIQKSDSHASPLHNHIVGRLKHWRHLDAVSSGALAVLGVVLETTCFVGLLQRQHAEVDEEATIPVLGQTGEELCAGELDLHDALHGLHERVRKPLCKLVEGKYALPGCDAVGLPVVGKGRERWAAWRLCRLGHRAAWPSVTEGGAVDGCARGWPDARQAVEEYVPQDRDRDDHCA